ncbi:MAG: pilus assembly protein PilM, partial [candidate division WOR-3 bacterium]|nr:pilus assembly protein PilM [candidate division WOR-3 bacterium]
MNSVVGLDIGQEWIKAVEITEDLKIKKVGRIKVPVDKEQEEAEQQIYIKKIKELFDTFKFPLENVVINFRGSYILTRTYLLPSPVKEEFETWFIENIQELVPGTPLEEVVYSYQILKSSRAIIAFAEFKEIEKQLMMLQNCNIIPSMIDASCLALYDTFILHPWVKAKKNLAILDMSNSQGDLLIVKEGDPISASVVNCHS